MTKKKKKGTSHSHHRLDSHKKSSKKKTKGKKTPSRKFSLRDNKDIAMDFVSQVHKRFGDVVKATILFGSEAKSEARSGSDIDIIIIIDDAGIAWDLELVSWYREELAKLITSNKYAEDLHVTTLKLTTWWNDLMHGDPVVINILRYGETLIDIGGFFKPLKALLLQGKIHSTPEAVYTALQRAPMHLARSKISELSAVEGIYWTMVDSAQAALITLGKLPPSPEHVGIMLKESFVDTGLLKIDYVRWYREILSIHKGIAHGEIKNIRGVEIEEWQNKAEKFLSKMIEIIDQLIEAQKKS
jgi:uncharacterized protein (UPF0332 family)/predicted nucleotidyltransferase